MEYTIDYFKDQLAYFLSNNPNSNIVQVRDRIVLEEPWDDKSLSILLSTKQAKQLVDALNSLILPPRFSSIFHIDTNTVEFIWGAISKDADIISRSFDLNFKGRSYKCYFAEASDRLRILAVSVLRRLYYSPSDYRNLISLKRHYLDLPKSPELPEEYIAISFFITGFESYAESLLMELSKNLNFNMLYFDRKSPYILIHSLPLSSEIANDPIQYISDSFPNIIVSTSKDPLLLDLSSAALESDVRMSYLYYYQVIERAAYFYLSDITKSMLNKILHSPDIQTSTEAYIDRIVETVLVDAKSDDESKIEKVTKSLCNPNVLWKEISANIPFFSKPTTFDGGFTTNPIINEPGDYEYFCSCWHPSLIHQLRHIRNALAHGREKVFGYEISPTPHNDQLIRPWLSLIRRVAEEIILYCKVD